MIDVIFECICVFAFYFMLTYFIGTVAGSAADDIGSRTTDEKKDCNAAIAKRSRQMALFVATVSVFMHMVTTSSENTRIKQAEQEGIALVQDSPYEYIDDDVFRKYVADHIEDIKIDYDLLSYDDLY